MSLEQEKQDKAKSEGVSIPLVSRKAGPGLHTVVDQEDAEWASNFRWYLDFGGHAARVDNKTGKQIRLHREVLERKLVRALQRGEMTTHVNHQKLDNRRANLQPMVRKAQRDKRTRSASTRRLEGYTGVYWDK